MRIVYEYNDDEIGMHISGKPLEMVELGKRLEKIDNDIAFELEEYIDPFFEKTFLSVCFKKTENPNQMISIEILGNRIEFIGGSEYYDRLGGSFVNFYSEVSDPKAHFVMDRHDECIIAEDCMAYINCLAILE